MFRLLIREMHQCGKDPKRLVFLFGAALAYMLIFRFCFPHLSYPEFLR